MWNEYAPFPFLLLMVLNSGQKNEEKKNYLGFPSYSSKKQGHSMFYKSYSEIAVRDTKLLRGSVDFLIVFHG